MKPTFAELLIQLDMALTGKSVEQCQQSYRNQPRTADWFWEGHEYYLSDGGYSRLCLNVWKGRLFLTDNSLEKPKAAWDGCKELVEEVQTAIRESIGWTEEETL